MAFEKSQRDQSNCSVIELNQTQSNSIERLGSIGSEIEYDRTKKKRVGVRMWSICEPNRTTEIIQNIFFLFTM